MTDQPLPDDASPPMPNPTRRQPRWCRAKAPLLIVYSMVVIGCILFLLVMFLILHATTVPDIHVGSASSLSLSHEINNTTTIHGDFLFRIKNPSPFVSVKHMHVHVNLNIYHNYQSLMSTNISIPSFVVGRLKGLSFTSSTNSSASVDIMPSWKSLIIDVKLEAKRRLGIIGDWWIFAFTLYASCDDVAFTRSSDRWKWTLSDNNECSIDSFFDFV